MTSTDTDRQTAGAPAPASGMAADNRSALTERMRRAVGAGDWVRQLPDTPAATQFETFLTERSCGLPATTIAALAAIGVRTGTSRVGTGAGLPTGIELPPEALRWIRLADADGDAGRYVDLIQRIGRLHRRGPTRPLAVDDQGPQQRAALENALECALHARTAEEFGAALQKVMLATGRTQGEIVRQDGRTEEKWLSKSTVSRMVNGATIARHRGQVEAFVRACGGVDTYVEAWGLAWTQLREAIRVDRATTDGQDDAAPVHAEVDGESAAAPGLADQTPGASTAAGAGVDGSPTEDGVLLDVHVRVTKEHLMRAAPVLVAMGLLATANGRLPSGQELAVMALLGAAGFALFSHMQRVTPAANAGALRNEAPSGRAAERAGGVYMTAPRPPVT